VATRVGRPPPPQAPGGLCKADTAASSLRRRRGSLSYEEIEALPDLEDIIPDSPTTAAADAAATAAAWKPVSGDDDDLIDLSTIPDPSPHHLHHHDGDLDGDGESPPRPPRVRAMACLGRTFELQHVISTLPKQIQAELRREGLLAASCAAGLRAVSSLEAKAGLRRDVRMLEELLKGVQQKRQEEAQRAEEEKSAAGAGEGGSGSSGVEREKKRKNRRGGFLAKAALKKGRELIRRFYRQGGEEVGVLF